MLKPIKKILNKRSVRIGLGIILLGVMLYIRVVPNVLDWIFSAEYGGNSFGPSLKDDIPESDFIISSNEFTKVFLSWKNDIVGGNIRQFNGNYVVGVLQTDIWAFLSCFLIPAVLIFDKNYKLYNSVGIIGIFVGFFYLLINLSPNYSDGFYYIEDNFLYYFFHGQNWNKGFVIGCFISIFGGLFLVLLGNREKFRVDFKVILLIISLFYVYIFLLFYIFSISYSMSGILETDWKYYGTFSFIKNILNIGYPFNCLLGFALMLCSLFCFSFIFSLFKRIKFFVPLIFIPTAAPKEVYIHDVKKLDKTLSQYREKHRYIKPKFEETAFGKKILAKKRGEFIPEENSKTKTAISNHGAKKNNFNDSDDENVENVEEI